MVSHFGQITSRKKIVIYLITYTQTMICTCPQNKHHVVCTSRPTPALKEAVLVYDLSIEGILPECIVLNMWGVTEWMIKKDWETHRLLQWFQLWSQPARCWVFGRYLLKNLWETARRSDWLRVLAIMSKNNVPQINKPSHLKLEV